MSQDNTQDVYNRLSAPNDSDSSKINQVNTINRVFLIIIYELFIVYRNGHLF